MGDRIFAIDDQTFLFPEPVRDAYLGDIQARLTAAVADSVAAMPGIAQAVADKLAPLTADNVVAALFDSDTATRQALPVRWLAGEGIDATGTTSSTAAVQAFLDSTRDGDVVHVPAGAIINLTGPVSISKRITLTGGGELRWTSGVQHTAGLAVYAASATVQGLRLVNATGTAAATEDKQSGIWIAAQNVKILGNTVKGFQQGITVAPFGEYYGALIGFNHVLDVPGSGGGPSSASPTGEDRGDGIVVWGAGATVIGNYVTAAAGSDCRIGIHCEGIPSFESTPGAHSSALVTIQGNVVTGKFRRSIATEGVLGANIVGNTVADATWWGIGITGGNASVCADNSIIWTRASTDNQGAAFSPHRCAVMVYGTGYSTQVRGNTIRVEPGASMPYGIYVETNGAGSRDDLLIAGNIVVDQQYTMSAGIYCNGGGGVLNYLRVVDNTIRGHRATAIYASNAADPEISRNRITGLLEQTADGIVVENNNSGARVDQNSIYYANTAIKLLGRNQVTTAMGNLIFSAKVGVRSTGTSAVALDTTKYFSVTTNTQQ